MGRPPGGAPLSGFEEDPLIYEVGETAVNGAYNLTVVSIAECEGEPAALPGHLKLQVEVLIEGTGESHTAVSSAFAKLTDAEGHSYSNGAAGCEPELNAAQLRKGEIRRGWLSFELPDRADGLVLSYTPRGANPASHVYLGR